MHSKLFFVVFVSLLVVDRMSETFLSSGAKTRGMLVGTTPFMLTIKPSYVEYMLRSNFSNVLLHHIKPYMCQNQNQYTTTVTRLFLFLLFTDIVWFWLVTLSNYIKSLKIPLVNAWLAIFRWLNHFSSSTAKIPSPNKSL